MSNTMGPDQTQHLLSLIWVQTFCKSSPQIPVSCILYVKYHDSRLDPTLIEPDLGPNLFAKVHHNILPVKSLIKQHGSRSDLTIAKPDLGPNYLQKFPSTSCQLHPYVKQHRSRSDQTTVKPDLGPNYL